MSQKLVKTKLFQGSEDETKVEGYLTSIFRVEMVVYLSPLGSSSDRVLTPSLMPAPDIFQLIFAAGLPPLEMQVRLS